MPALRPKHPRYATPTVSLASEPLGTEAFSLLQTQTRRCQLRPRHPAVQGQPRASREMSSGQVQSEPGRRLSTVRADRGTYRECGPSCCRLTLTLTLTLTYRECGPSCRLGAPALRASCSLFIAASCTCIASCTTTATSSSATLYPVPTSSSATDPQSAEPDPAVSGLRVGVGLGTTPSSSGPEHTTRAKVVLGFV